MNLENVYGMRPQARKTLGQLVLRGTQGLSPNQAFAWEGIANLRARVCELRDAGFRIRTVPMITRPGHKYILSLLA